MTKVSKMIEHDKKLKLSMCVQLKYQHKLLSSFIKNNGAGTIYVGLCHELQVTTCTMINTVQFIGHKAKIIVNKAP